MALDKFRLVGGGQFFQRCLRSAGLQAGGRQRGQIYKSYKNPTESHGRTWIQQQTPETLRWFRSAYARWNERGTQFLQEKTAGKPNHRGPEGTQRELAANPRLRPAATPG